MPKEAPWLVLIHLHHADRDYCEGRQYRKTKEALKQGLVPSEMFRAGSGGAKFWQAANKTTAVKGANQWCGWAHSYIDAKGNALAPVERSSRWAIHERLERIGDKWRSVII